MSAPPDTLQQHQQNTSNSPPPNSASTPSLTSSSSVSADPLTCQWSQCRERCTSPEALYDHVCERHVGRKSTNNLNLQCQWGTCHTTTVKRDHITSHIRVHVPLKPHKCEFCGKSFKRPQDLKKHVKTHADESVILRSPEPPVTSQKPSIVPNSYQHVSSRQTGYYQEPHSHVQGNNYGYPTAIASHGHYGQSMGTPSYGPVYYNVPQTNGFAASGVVESRKRGFDELNDFFGNVKRRQVDAAQYQDLGARFSNLISPGMPMSSFQAGYHAGLRAAGGGGVDEPMGASTAYQAQTSQTVPSVQNQFSMPFAELKTKSDLMTIDDFLEQLQHTVYEHPDQAAAGVQHHTGFPQTYRNSPNHFTHQPSVSSVGSTPDTYPGGLGATGSVFDDNISTPALTPSSYAAAAHSPASSQTNMSPASRPINTTGSLYPSLPSFSTLTDVHGVPQVQLGNAAPLSNLGSAYDDFETRRRHSGGFLQQPAPARSMTRVSADSSDRSSNGSAADCSSAGASPSSRRSSMELSRPFGNVALSSPKPAIRPNPIVKLPGVADITRGSIGERERGGDEKQEGWVRNMRVIEELARYVRSRLERGDYVDEDGVGAAGEERERERQRSGGQWGAERERERQEGEQQQQRQQQQLYPVLRAVEATS